MNCCQLANYEKEFDTRQATKDLNRYHRRGPDSTTKILINALTAEGVENKRLLDIGGGIGSVQHELLKAGVKEVISVDASKSYMSAAREESKRQGYADRVHEHYGDFVDLSDQIPGADIVTLDRVICCFADMTALVTKSADHASRLIGVVYPRDDWLGKFLVTLVNLFRWLMRSNFRAYSHSTNDVDRVLNSKGFQSRFHHNTLLWQVWVYSH